MHIGACCILSVQKSKLINRALQMAIYGLECARPFDVDRLKLSDFQKLANMSVNQRKKYYVYISACIGRKDQVEVGS